jgi:hypothetical protein
MDVRHYSGGITGRGNRITRRKRAPMPRCRKKKLRGLWVWSTLSATDSKWPELGSSPSHWVEHLRFTVCANARPMFALLHDLENGSATCRRSCSSESEIKNMYAWENRGKYLLPSSNPSVRMTQFGPHWANFRERLPVLEAFTKISGHNLVVTKSGPFLHESYSFCRPSCCFYANNVKRLAVQWDKAMTTPFINYRVDRDINKYETT